MATVFRQQGRNLWEAKVKLWDHGKQAWVWKRHCTGVTDRTVALSIANTLEKASGEAKNGHMTRAKAEALVMSVLQMAGVPWGLRATILEEYGNAYSKAAADRHKDPLKAKPLMHWERFKNWAGSRIKWPMENWTKDMFQEYYSDLLKEYSERTTNDHIATLRQMFGKAGAEGKVRGNPVALVDKESANSIEKVVFTRNEVAKILKTTKTGHPEWFMLTLLGWHTGHRIQDLLDLTKADVKEIKNVGKVLSITPNKKEGKGGRTVLLPVPAFVSGRLERMGNFSRLHGADNRNGRISNEFVKWLIRLGIDPKYVERGNRKVPRKSFHSFRHSMASRLAAAGVEGNLARLVTDHDSEQVHAHYTHAEINSIATALKKARRV